VVTALTPHETRAHFRAAGREWLIEVAWSCLIVHQLTQRIERDHEEDFRMALAFAFATGMAVTTIIAQIAS
jgi:hypothetical protein